jgi:hypothetical protein
MKRTPTAPLIGPSGTLRRAVALPDSPVSPGDTKWSIPISAQVVHNSPDSKHDRRSRNDFVRRLATR